ncbi:MAG: transposase [Candidatus Sericytochromatia bacterium]
MLVSWSHSGRVRSEAAFASLAGAAPLEASSGQRTRHRLNRGGDRNLNRALHTVAVTRLRCHEESRLPGQAHTRGQDAPGGGVASSAHSLAGSTASSRPATRPPRHVLPNPSPPRLDSRIGRRTACCAGLPRSSRTSWAGSLTRWCAQRGAGGGGRERRAGPRPARSAARGPAGARGSTAGVRRSRRDAQRP